MRKEQFDTKTHERVTRRPEKEKRDTAEPSLALEATPSS